MRKNILGATLGLLSFLLPGAASAWWDMGHMTVAAVAYEQLEPSVKTKVAALLRLNPDFNSWVQGASNGEEDRIAFLRASTWPDDIKHRSDYRHGSIGQDGPDASANVGYSDHMSHDYWHFVDFPFSPDGTVTPSPEKPNALTQINSFKAVLASNENNELKSYDLVWLIHLVGDVHQPLHTTSRFTRAAPSGDRGGNEERVCLAFVCGSKLHAYWDGLLGDQGSIDRALALAASLPAANVSLAAEDATESWVNESAQLAKRYAYTQTIGAGDGPFTLDQGYQDNAKRVAQEQVALAGARLARLINAALH